MTYGLKEPTQKMLEYLNENYSYDKLSGTFSWITEGGNGASKHVVGDVVPCNYKSGYAKIYAGSRYLNASHCAWWFATGQWPTESIDHINRDQKDNRFCNLREAGRHIQSQNRKGWNKEGLPKGVQRRGDRFRAYKNKTHLGVFDTVVEAKQAYEAAYV